jgi:hypothetical protein
MFLSLSDLLRITCNGSSTDDHDHVHIDNRHGLYTISLSNFFAMQKWDKKQSDDEFNGAAQTVDPNCPCIR